MPDRYDNHRSTHKIKSNSAPRYFACPKGQGLFLPERWVRRSFVQRPPQPPPAPPAFRPPASSKIPRPRVFSSGSSSSPRVQPTEVFPSLAALLQLPLTAAMAHDQAGVIYGLPLPTSVVEVAAGVQRPRRAKGKAAKRVEPEAEAPALAIAKAKAGAPRFVTGAGDVTAFEATGSSSNGSSEGSQSARASPLGTTTSGAADDDEDMAAGGAKGSTQAWNGCAARTAAGTAGTGTGIRAGKGEREGLWRTQSFEDRLSISSSAAAVDPATREEEVVVVDLVHEALQRAAHARASAHQLQLQLQGEQHGGPGLGGASRRPSLPRRPPPPRRWASGELMMMEAAAAATTVGWRCTSRRPLGTWRSWRPPWRRKSSRMQGLLEQQRARAWRGWRRRASWGQRRPPRCD